MSALFDLENASLRSEDSVLLEEMNWQIRDRGVTVILGPAGTGKSTLLRSLAGQRPPGVELCGSWRFAGGAIDVAAERVAFLPQRKRPRAWRDALDMTGVAAVLLDEPTVGLSSTESTELAAALRARSRSAAVALVTHDVSFAERVADDIGFICAGRLAAHGPARELFAAPPDDLFERFLKQGNCWPGPPPLRLPSHFRWILPLGLAGMARPGLVGKEDSDLLSIASAGVNVLITLTEDPFPATKLAAYGIRGRHFPIVDMGVPAVGPTARLCRDIERDMREGNAVAVHCHAGLGRTGTILAAMLVWLGRSAQSAVSEVRSHTNLYIQSNAQLDFVDRFAEACGPKSSEERP